MKFSSCRSFSIPALLTLAVSVFASPSASPMQAAVGHAAIPPRPVDSPPANKPSIDAGARALLKKFAETMLALKTYRAEVREAVTYSPKRLPLTVLNASRNGGDHRYRQITLTAEKPDIARFEEWEMLVSPEGKWSHKTPLHGDDMMQRGKAMISKSDDGKPEYRYDEHFLTLDEFGVLWCGFFTLSHSPYGNVKRLFEEGTLRGVHFNGQEEVDGILCDKVFVGERTVMASTSWHPYTAISKKQCTYDIGPDNLIHRETIRLFEAFDKDSSTMDCVAHNLQVNQPIPNSASVFSIPPPPKGVEKTRPQ